MNFIEQQGSAFTYRRALTLLVGWCCFLALLHVAGILREMSLERKVVATQQRIDQLNQEKDTSILQLAKSGRQRVSVAAQGDIVAILSHRPIWSGVLKRITDSLPQQVWIESIGTDIDKSGLARLKIQGKARSQRVLSTMVTAIEDGGFFIQTEIAGTQRVPGVEGLVAFEVITTPVLQKFERL